jgi:hypothetical protein
MMSELWRRLADKGSVTMQRDPSPGFHHSEVSSTLKRSECTYCGTAFISSPEDLDQIQIEHRKKCSKRKNSEKQRTSHNPLQEPGGVRLGGMNGQKGHY